MLQPSTDQTAAVTPEPILKNAMGFMAAKHLFAASEPGLFEALANDPAKLDELAKCTAAPPRTAGIVAAAIVSLGLIERDGSLYRNNNPAVTFFAGESGKVFDQLRDKNAATNERVLDPLTPQEREILFDLLIRIIRQNKAYARPGTGRRKRRPNQARFDKNKGVSATSPRHVLSKQE